MKIRFFTGALVLIASTLVFTSHASAATTVAGGFGQKLSISTSKLSSAKKMLVTGSGFDESVGIYLAYCVLPKKSMNPTPCGNGINKAGIGEASYWISSNPPPYGKGLAIPFKAGGRFSQQLEVSTKIGSFDCTKVKCAVTVRSDHLHEGDRKNDLFIPITFTKK